MSLQDDIFDVAAALEGKPEGDAFNRIVFAMNTFEKGYEQSARKLSILKDAFEVIKGWADDPNSRA